MAIGLHLFPIKLHYIGGGGGGDYSPKPPPRRPKDTDDRDPCDLEFEAVLQSMDLALLPLLRVGQSLPVEIVMEQQKERLCTTLNGKIVGAIVSPFSTTVIECIQAGNRYQANITEISGNVHRVRVKRV